MVSAGMLVSAINYFVTEESRIAFSALGFPDFFRIELGIAKFIGAIVLLLPRLPVEVRMFTYSGFAIVFTSAIVSHLSSADPILITLKAFFFLILLVISYISSGQIRNTFANS